MTEVETQLPKDKNKFEATKRVKKSRKKDRQYNDDNKKVKQ